MKSIIVFSFLLFINFSDHSNFTILENGTLEPCPSSPNCVCTKEKGSKKMKPIPFSKDIISVKNNLRKIVETNSRVKLIEEKENYLHYEFKTKFGKFIDDVEFRLDEKTKQIHFRSASRKGWYDFGKNKRRMKKIRKTFIKNNKKED